MLTINILKILIISDNGIILTRKLDLLNQSSSQDTMYTIGLRLEMENGTDKSFQGNTNSYFLDLHNFVLEMHNLPI